MNSIVAFPIALAYREPYSDDITQKIAVNKNNLRQYWYTITNYPDAQLVVCDTIEDCIKALKNGDADSTLLSALRVSHLLGNEKKLNIITLTDDEKVCLAIANGNTALLQIVNHGISILGESYGLNHTYRYLDSLATYTLTDVVQDHVWLFAGMMVCLHLAKAPGELPKTENVEYPAELFAGKRILLAEDNILNREIAVAILEKTGFKVDIAENGAIAVEKVKNSTKGYYAAILMDIQMPVMDGYAATRAIRALEDPVLANIPVLAVSANAFDEDMAASRAAGMNGHLAKPIIASELLGTLGKVLFTDS